MDSSNKIGQPYGTPATVPPPGKAPPQGPVPIIINQDQPVTVVNPNMFKTTPIAMTCMFCKKPMTTVVTKKFNCCACLLCYCTGLLCYICIQCCRGKDICCWDADHTCPLCGNLVGTYIAC